MNEYTESVCLFNIYNAVTIIFITSTFKYQSIIRFIEMVMVRMREREREREKKKKKKKKSETFHNSI